METQTYYTAGPWFSPSPTDHEFWITDKNGARVAQAFKASDARLIKSAPRLRSLLKRALTKIQSLKSGDRETYRDTAALCELLIAEIKDSGVR